MLRSGEVNRSMAAKKLMLERFTLTRPVSLGKVTHAGINQMLHSSCIRHCYCRKNKPHGNPCDRPEGNVKSLEKGIEGCVEDWDEYDDG
jgi:hypothetical protein